MSDTGETFEGGCACGAVRYRMESRPIITHCCHCHWCQRVTGTAFSVNAMVEADQVALLAGAPEAVPTPSTLPEGQLFHRCPRCRVRLWTNHPSLGEGVRFVAVGTLDEPARVPPDIHVHTASKLPWVVVPEGAPAFAEDYNPEEVWADARIARLAALQSL